MEYFYEQFQTKDYKELEKKLKLTSKVILILAAISLFFLQIGVLLFLLIILAIVQIYKFKSIVEYEYELTADQLSINKIRNKSKRKEIVSFSIKQIVSIKDKNNNPNEKVIEASLDGIGIKEKIIKVKVLNETISIKLALDENLINIIKRVNPIAFY